jgi:subtilisin family serine protease
MPQLYAPNTTCFAESTSGTEQMPTATPKELAAALIECIDAGACVLNLSLALAQPSTKGEQSLEEALNQAVRRGVIVVVAAGNQGTLGSSAITRHPWVIRSTFPEPCGGKGICPGYRTDRHYRENRSTNLLRRSV